jgi:hypothetical protein
VGKVVGIAAYLAKHTYRKKVSAHTQYALALTEEISWLARFKWEHVIVEIEVFLIKVFNIVKVHLNGVAIEGGQQMVGDDILVQYHVHLIAIQPLRYLTFA